MTPKPLSTSTRCCTTCRTARSPSAASPSLRPASVLWLNSRQALPRPARLPPAQRRLLKPLKVPRAPPKVPRALLRSRAPEIQTRSMICWQTSTLRQSTTQPLAPMLMQAPQVCRATKSRRRTKTRQRGRYGNQRRGVLTATIAQASSARPRDAAATTAATWVLRAPARCRELLVQRRALGVRSACRSGPPGAPAPAADSEAWRRVDAGRTEGCRRQ